MNWNDRGYLLSKNKYNENSIIAEFFTENHGKCSGIIFGASSKKIKNYLQIGNILHINHTFKNVSKIGYFKVEILNALTPQFFDNKNKLMCIASAMNLVKILTVDAQENVKVFELISHFFNFLPKNDWIKNYIFWELELLKLVGYDLELKKLANEEIINNQVKYYAKSNYEKKFIPNFLVDENVTKLNNKDLLQGLRLVGDYLDKSILRPNNINPPISRVDFVNLLK